MIHTLDLSDKNGGYRRLLPRSNFNVEQAVELVRPICDAVASQGIVALEKFSEQFDQIVPESFRVPAELLEQSAQQLPTELREAFEVAITRRRKICQELETEPEQRSAQLASGAIIHQAVLPVERVGLYVPGGLAPLASSVIMNVIPAQVAGVKSIAVASPPQIEFGGWPHPNILGLCQLLGVAEVYAVGGAQAIAMFGYGVEGLCEPVNMVTGPGNIYVVAAKRVLKGVIGIDAEAGPTEIAILADDSANPKYVAADLISQAEHDNNAAAILITDSTSLAELVKAEIINQVATAKHEDRIKTALAGKQSAIVLVRDLTQAIAVANAYAAEHLEIQTRNADQVARRIINAGAIFVGDYSPVSLGDYSAGSTHVLPTAGCACHSSGLNVRSFMRYVHVINYTEQALNDIATGVEKFALAEDLPSHANAITVRRG
ncbi:MAG: histidinol dehydrogenase [Propionibacterium sp.]|nr:MAG: histidinol dehydrogenase [Propionibacterium sp.]